MEIDEKLSVGSLFSGIGGIELGLERTGGFRTSWFCERNEYAKAVLAKNWPDVPIYGDVLDLYESEFPEKVEVLTGGFPCQPFSTAGRRKGMSDERYLWPEFLRIVRQVRPRWVVAENVPGILSIEAGRVFGRILRDLSGCGYDVEWDTISAASVGAIHPRNRIFVLGHLLDPEHDGLAPPEVRGGSTEGSVRGASRTFPASEPTGPDYEPGELAEPDLEGLAGRENGRIGSGERDAREGGPIPDPSRGRGRGRDVRRPRIAGYARPLERGRGDNRLGAFRNEFGKWWDAEPVMGRVVDGLPAWLDGTPPYSLDGLYPTAWGYFLQRTAPLVPYRRDRLQALGNSVVPQASQYIGERILEYERGGKE